MLVLQKNTKLDGYFVLKRIQFLLISGTTALLLWNENWTSFLDTMIQMIIISTERNGLSLPTRLRKLAIDPVAFTTALRNGKG
jgi:fatty acid synthase